MTNAILGLVACFFFGLGVFGLVAPSKLIEPFRLTADTTESRAEIRAVYGGFGVAVGVVLVLAAKVVGTRAESGGRLRSNPGELR